MSEYERKKIGLSKRVYRNYWNRSRPCIILESFFPRLVLKLFSTPLQIVQKFLMLVNSNGPLMPKFN